MTVEQQSTFTFLEIDIRFNLNTCERVVLLKSGNKDTFIYLNHKKISKEGIFFAYLLRVGNPTFNNSLLGMLYV